MNAIKNFFTATDYKDIPFFYSVWFTVALSVFSYLFWFFNVGIYGITVFLALVGVVLALCRDIAPVAGGSMFVVQMINNSLDALNSFVWYTIGFAVMAIGLVIHLIRFKPFRSYGKIKGFLVAAAGLGVAMAIGGITVTNRAVLPAITVVGLSVLSILAVFFLYKTMGRDDPKRLTRILLINLLALAFLVMAEMITVIIRTGDPFGAISSKYKISTGWGHPNYLANILARGVPVAIYLSTREKKGSEWWLFAALFFGLGIILTSSRSALLVALVIALVCAIYYVPKMEHKTTWICIFLMIIGLTLIGFGVLGERVRQVFATLVRHKFDSSGRFDLWKLAWERFTQHPIFGVGFDYDLGGRTELNPTNTAYTPYWYHNTIFQTLCSLGIVGFVAFCFFIFRQYQAMYLSKNPAVYALGFTLLLIQGISMLDIYFYVPQDYLFMLVLTLPGVQMLSEDKANTFFYPLWDLCKKLRKKEKAK